MSWLVENGTEAIASAPENVSLLGTAATAGEPTIASDVRPAARAARNRREAFIDLPLFAVVREAPVPNIAPGAMDASFAVGPRGRGHAAYATDVTVGARPETGNWGQ
ncbi:hypothetical protein IDVR_13420 [Intrasporangium sp. DVR]